jgi:peptide/nickel transport system permease protein
LFPAHHVRVPENTNPRPAFKGLVRRLGDAALLLWLVVTLIFGLVRLAPGDPAAFLIPPTATAADAARLRGELGLDRPLAVQYVRWGAALLKGDLGESFASHRPVVEVIRAAAPISLFLGMTSLALTFLVGVPVGMLQASRRGRGTDTALTVITTTVYAAPSFWIALALVAVFTYGAVTLGLPPWLRLPAFGIRTPGEPLSGWAALSDLARHAALPVFTLAAVGAAGIARYARSGAADLLPQDFVRTARAKGASPLRVYLGHVLPAMTPQLVILFALSLPGIVAGSVFVESVFSWPGMGRAMLLAIQARDYPVVMGASVAYAAAVIGANLAADLLTPLIDPRRRGARA